MERYCVIFVFSVVIVRYGSTQGFDPAEQFRAFLEANNRAVDNHVMGMNGFLSQLERNCEAGNIPSAHCNQATQAFKKHIQLEQSHKFSSSEPSDMSRVINDYLSFTNDPTFSSGYPVNVHRNVEITDNGNGKEVKVTFHAQSETKGNYNFDEDGNMYISNTNNYYQDASNGYSRGVYDDSGSQSNSKYPSQIDGNSYPSTKTTLKPSPITKKTPKPTLSPKRTPRPSPSTKITLRPSSSTIRTPRPSSSTMRTPRPSSSTMRTPKPSSSTKTTQSPSPSTKITLRPSSSTIRTPRPSSSTMRTPRLSSSTKTTQSPSLNTLRTPRPSSSTQRTLRPSSSPSRTLKPRPSTKTTQSPSPRHEKTLNPKDNELPDKYAHEMKQTMNINRINSTLDTPEQITRYSNTQAHYSNVGAKRNLAKLTDNRNKTYSSFSLTQDDSYATDRGLNGTSNPKIAIEIFTTIKEPSKSKKVNTEPMNTRTERANGYKTTEESIQDFVNTGATNHSDSREKPNDSNFSKSNFNRYNGFPSQIENNGASNHSDFRQKPQPHQPKITEPEYNETLPSDIDNIGASNHSNSRENKQQQPKILRLDEDESVTNSSKTIVIEEEDKRTVDSSEPTFEVNSIVDSTHEENSTFEEVVANVSQEKSSNTSVIVGVVSGVILFCALIVTGTLLCRQKDKKPILSPLDDQKARFDAYADTTPVTEPVYEDIPEIETMGNQTYVYDNAYEYRYFHNPEPDIYNHIIYKES